MQNRDRIEERLWVLRRPVQFLADVAVLASAFLLAYSPAINFRVGDQHFDTAINQLPFVVLVQVSVLFLVGGYSIIWRYISISDIKVFLAAAAASGGILLALRLLLSYTDFNRWQVPISVIFIDTCFAFGGMLALRVLRRFVYELAEKNKHRRSKHPIARTPALLVGAGRLGASLAREMGGRADAELEIRGLVDDDARKTGGKVGGIKVLGTTDDLPRLVDELGAKQIVIALDKSSGREIRSILDICSSIPIKAQIVPSLHEIAHGRVSLNLIRDVQIEDILGREPVKIDDENLHDFLTGKTVMVTGAGGSIGAELVRQIARYQPRKLLLVERAEHQLFQIERELSQFSPMVSFEPLMADVGDEQRMREIFERTRPDVILHAAAHKHVPLMESNAAEAVKNNVFATRMLGVLAGEYGVGDFVLISTDKAVNPTSVMGASKRLAEIVVQNLDATYATNFVAVRFGNVLGSAGSVVPIFSEQIQKGEAITVTDKAMTRYFMTIPEASQLVLQAGALGSGGEIFILDMGEPVKIIDLAEDMIRLSGLVPYEDIDIIYTGARKGEKLFEELEINGENLETTHHPKIFIGKIATYSASQVSDLMEALKVAVDQSDPNRIRNLFNSFLPEAAVITDDDVPTMQPVPEQEIRLSHATAFGMAEK